MMHAANGNAANDVVLQILSTGIVNTYNFGKAVSAGAQYRVHTVYLAAN